MSKEEYLKSKKNIDFDKVSKDGRTFDKYGSLSSDYLSEQIKKLSKPNFLGSIHLKDALNANNNAVDNLLKSELELKLAKSLKNTFLNPITKTLITLTLIFNIIWFLLIYLF
ncbi:MAG: hypothetical protein ACFE9T_12885 [Promethearchaeota archaeon]